MTNSSERLAVCKVSFISKRASVYADTTKFIWSDLQDQITATVFASFVVPTNFLRIANMLFQTHFHDFESLLLWFQRKFGGSLWCCIWLAPELSLTSSVTALIRLPDGAWKAQVRKDELELVIANYGSIVTFAGTLINLEEVLYEQESY